jgi:carbon dioxide concentrating mechanism protein CcmN
MSSLTRSTLPALIHDNYIFVSGNVVIHPSAAIAPSVMLQADPGSQLVVGEGVCIGVGCVLHAYQGTVEVKMGATLGSGVLVIGQGKIGENACIGAMTTIINSSVLAGAIIPPGSLIGDHSRSAVSIEADPTAESSDASDPWFTPNRSRLHPSAPPPHSAESPTPQPAPSDPTQPSEEDEMGVKVVYGRAAIERMMITMFPHRKSSMSPPPDE